ncbi:MAG: hypothetical protein ABSD78_11650 [Acidimicrobiales bacterium]|jgi:hypothetical protein
MAKFVLLYAGHEGMGDTPEEADALATAWMTWYRDLGDSVLDSGGPLGPAVSIVADGSTRQGLPLTGYLIISADSLSEATDKAAGCPVLSDGGTIDVHEALPF